jgi:hypothetical protein
MSASIIFAIFGFAILIIFVAWLLQPLWRRQPAPYQPYRPQRHSSGSKTQSHAEAEKVGIAPGTIVLKPDDVRFFPGEIPAQSRRSKTKRKPGFKTKKKKAVRS